MIGGASAGRPAGAASGASVEMEIVGIVGATAAVFAAGRAVLPAGACEPGMTDEFNYAKAGSQPGCDRGMAPGHHASVSLPRSSSRT